MYKYYFSQYQIFNEYFLYSEIAIICGVEYYRFDRQLMIPIIIKFLKEEPKVLNGNL